MYIWTQSIFNSKYLPISILTQSGKKLSLKMHSFDIIFRWLNNFKKFVHKRKV